jgi:FAD-linked sulfhydryl oxidase
VETPNFDVFQWKGKTHHRSSGFHINLMEKMKTSGSQAPTGARSATVPAVRMNALTALQLCLCLLAIWISTCAADEVADSNVTSNVVSPSDWKAAIGRSTWHLLHSVAAKYPDTPSDTEKHSVVELFSSLQGLYPCEICRLHLAENLRAVPPLQDHINSRSELSLWVCQLHNVVNRELHKPVFNCSLEALDELYLANCGGCGLLDQGRSKSSKDASTVVSSSADGLKVFPSQGLFVPVPTSGRQQTGVCASFLNQSNVNEWIQGNSSTVSLVSGSVTVIFFMSQTCHVCHDVAPKLNKLYRTFRHRGLNLIAVHASPKGYQSTPQDKDGLRQFILEEQLEFPIVDVHAKVGKQPVLSDGTPDWEAAGTSKVKKNSFFRKIFSNQPEYYVPIATVWKDCSPIIQDPVSGYDIMGLYDTIELNAEQLLWTEKSKRKRRVTSSRGSESNEL